MIRELYCDECELVVREDQLFVHLVKIHHWQPLRHTQQIQPHHHTPNKTRLNYSLPSHTLPANSLPQKDKTRTIDARLCCLCYSLVATESWEFHRKICDKEHEGFITENQNFCPLCDLKVGENKITKHLIRYHPDFNNLLRNKNTTDTDLLKATIIALYHVNKNGFIEWGTSLPARQLLSNLAPGLKKIFPLKLDQTSNQFFYDKVRFKKILETLGATRQDCLRELFYKAATYLNAIGLEEYGKPKQHNELGGTCNDPEIAAYLVKHPAPSDDGPFGKPQAIRRNGTFGLNGMEYDAWGRNK